MLNVDDLLSTLHYHWGLCNGWYASERQRVQLALMLLLIAYTSARPSALVQCHGPVTDAEVCEDEQDFAGPRTSHEASFDSLKYKDVAIYKVKAPDGKNEHVFIMVVTLRLMKGSRNKGLAYASFRCHFDSKADYRS